MRLSPHFPRAIVSVLTLLAALLSGCGGGSGADGYGGIYRLKAPELGAVRVDFVFPTAAPKSANAQVAPFSATSTVIVNVIDPVTHDSVVPPETSRRPAGAQTMNVDVPDVPPGNYRVLVRCLDAQGNSTGFAIPPATVYAYQTTVVEISETLQISRLTVSPKTAASLIGETQQFTATAVFSNGQGVDVTPVATWVSSNPVVATVTDGDATGVTPGTTAITATLGIQSDTAQFTVGITDLSISPVVATVEVGNSQRYTATATFSDGSTRDVSDGVDWSVGSASKAAVDKGTVVGLADGATTVTASLEGQRATALLNVTSTVSIASIAVTPDTATIAPNATQAFTAMATYTDGTIADVTQSVAWTTSNPNVADIDVSGVAIGIAAGGPVTITASLGATSGTAQLTVAGGATLTSITVTPANPSILVQTSQAFTATATYSDTTQRDVTTQVNWTSANTAVAEIDDTGVALGLQAGGPIVISATLGGATGTANLIVTTPVTLVGIAVTPDPATILVNNAQGFTATATFSDASTADVTSQATWTSSNPAVAPIDELGLAQGLARGTATITATLAAFSDSATLNVVKPSIVSLTVTPLSAIRQVGDPQGFTASATLSDGSTDDVTLQVAWSSAIPAIAIIDEVGSALGLSPGTTLIGATLGALQATATFEVTATPPPPPPPVAAPLLIADTANCRVVRVNTDATQWKSVGQLGQQGANLRFNYPRSAVQGRTNGNTVVYVADQRNNQIVRFTDFGAGQWTTIGRSGAGQDQFNNPSSVDQFSLNGYQQGAILVADFGNRRIVQFSDSHAMGNNQRICGWKTQSAGLSGPLVARASRCDDRIYVADISNRILQFSSLNDTHPRAFGSTGSGDHQFSRPVDMKIDTHGRTYVADSANNRIVRFDDMAGKNWTTFGSYGSGINQLKQPSGIELLADGRVAIHDTGNSRIVIINDMHGGGWSTYGTPGAGVGQFNQPDLFVGN